MSSSSSPSSSISGSANANAHHRNIDRGRLLIVHADITKFACDTWCAAKGGTLDPYCRSAYEFGRLARRAQMHAATSVNCDCVKVGPCLYETCEWPPRSVAGSDKQFPRPYLLHLDGGFRTAQSGRHGEGFVDAVANLLCAYVDRAVDNFGQTAPLFGRSKHLVSTPLVATGYGGLFQNTGVVLKRYIQDLAEKSASRDVDIALVIIEEDSYHAAQRVRWTLYGAPPREFLPGSVLSGEVAMLGNLASKGKLAIFMGAGVSMGAGLPDWGGLLRKLALEVSIDYDQFKKLSYLDQAHLLKKRLAAQSRDLGKEIAKALQSQYYSLAHAYLAALPCDSAITTNYDDLYETAYRSTKNQTVYNRRRLATRMQKKRLSILPYVPLVEAESFLLKLHGCVHRPNDIVLTRQDYLRYAENRAVLGGVLQSAMMNKHLLYVGFSLTDSNFHAMLDDVRKAVPNVEMLKERNTALALKMPRLEKELWADEVDIVTMLVEGEADTTSFGKLARRQEIFLDALCAEVAVNSATFFLTDRFCPLLSDEESTLRDVILKFKSDLESIPRSVRDSPAFKKARDMLYSLGSRKFANPPPAPNGNVRRSLMSEIASRLFSRTPPPPAP